LYMAELMSEGGEPVVGRPTCCDGQDTGVTVLWFDEEAICDFVLWCPACEAMSELYVDVEETAIVLDMFNETIDVVLLLFGIHWFTPR
jgi:hypothetical protein